MLNTKKFSGICNILLIQLSFLAFQASGGAIKGQVKNSQSQQPVKKASVQIENTEITVFTDSSGSFILDSIKPGSYNILVTHEKYESQTLNDIFISSEETKHLDIELNPPLQKLEKIVVKGNAFRKPPEMASSTKTMNFDEILRSPGALVDVQRAVQDLPSVSSGGDNTNEIIVRGGNPGENLLLMDNIEIPNPNHFADQGSGGGVVSLINPLLVKNLVFSAGAPPAMYGGKASSVLDVKLRDGNDKVILGGVDIGMAGVGFHAEGPLWNGATFMASGTKSFLDLFAHYAKTTAIPEFWGVQTKVAQTIEKHKLYGNFLYGDNEITIGDAQSEAGTDGDVVKAGGTIYASGINWDAKWSDRLSSTLTFSGTGNSFSRFEYSDTASGDITIRDSFFVNNSVESEQCAKLQGYYLLGDNKLQAGAFAKRCDFSIDIWERPDTVRFSDHMQIFQKNAYSDEVAYKFGGYLSGILYPFPKLRLIPGVRVDHFTFIDATTISPRLGAVFGILPALDLTAAVALQYQDPDYSMLAAASANKAMKPKKVLTGIGGAEYTYKPHAAKFSVEGFYKKYYNLPVDYSLTTSDPYDKSDTILSIGKGYSYGIEFFFQKKLTDHFSWTVSYSHSRAYNKDRRPSHEGEWYRSDYDFRNALTVSGGYKIDLIDYDWYKKLHSKWWAIVLSPVLPVADRIELSAKWRYLGGRPYTPKTYVSDHWIIDQDELNSETFDAYHRLDFRIERRYGFGFLNMIYYIDFQNMYNRQNIWMYLYSNKNNTKTSIYQFPFFPAGGVIIGF